MGEKLGSLYSLLADPVYKPKQIYGMDSLRYSINISTENRLNSKASTRASSHKRNISLRDRIDLSAREYENSVVGYVNKSNPKEKKSIISLATKKPNKRKLKFSRPHSEIPDYSSIESRVHSFRENENYATPIPGDVPLRERVKNELLMKNYHHVIRAMRKVQRENEEFEIKESRINNDVFDRLSFNLRNPNKIMSPPRIRFYRESEDNPGVIFKQNVANHMSLAINVAKWHKKRMRKSPEPLSRLPILNQ